jgi:uridine phosphorylase
LKITYHVGATRSGDNFYARQASRNSSFNNFWQSNWEHFQEDMKALNVMGSEMETGIVLMLPKIWKLRAAAWQWLSIIPSTQPMIR